MICIAVTDNDRRKSQILHYAFMIYVHRRSVAPRDALVDAERFVAATEIWDAVYDGRQACSHPEFARPALDVCIVCGAPRPSSVP